MTALKTALEGEDVETIKARTTDLMQASMKLGEAMYSANQGAGPEAGAEAGASEKKDDVIEMAPKSQKMIVLRHNLDTIDRAVPMWLDATPSDYKVVVRDQPLREQIDVPVREQLIVELYSK